LGLKDGKEVRRFQAHPPRPKEKSESPWFEGLVHALAFSPDGRTLASTAMHSPVRLWDVATGKEVLCLRGNPQVASSLALSPDGKVLAAGDGMRTVRLWETATGKEIRRIQAHQGCLSGLALARNGEVLLTSGDGAICLWDVRSGAEILPYRGHSAGIVSGVLSADGRTLITGSSDGSVRWWDRATGNELRRLAAPVESLQGGMGMALSPDGSIAAYRTEKSVGEHEFQGDIELWDLTARQKMASLWRPNIFAAQFSPDGKTLFTQVWGVGQKCGCILAWDTATGKVLRTLARNPDGFEQVLQLSPDGKVLAGMTSGREQSVYLWDAATGKELGRIPASPDFVQCLAFSPDNQLLALADGSRRQPDSRVLHAHIHLHDITTGKEERRLGSTLRGYGSVAFSADGSTLVTADEENQVRLWEVATGGERLRLAGHAGQVGGLLFADDGRTLISTSSDTTALVWDLTGLRGHARAADGKRPSGDLQGLWNTLADPDAAAAYRALWDLTAAPREAVAFLREHVRRVEPPEEKKIARWVRDLDSPEFATRERASEELAKLEGLAEPALRKALSGQPSPEMRRRIGQLLEQLTAISSGVDLRLLRVVEAVEHIGTLEARELLESLARGAPGARLTRAAQAALRRLDAARR
jgi:WD40 repeat protein